MTIRILTPKSEYTTDYPIAIEFAKQQAEIFWLPDEIEVEKDLHDLKTNFSESEYHGVISTLKLFTIYELSVGNDYWQNYITKLFPRPDIQRMATTFAFMEIGVHAPFYNKINEALGLDTDEFYNSYKEDAVLANRMAWIGKRTEKKDTVYNILKSVGVFSMIEGAVLYSSFAFLKHFNSAGKNKLININAGINFSAIDETLHSQAGAWLFRTLLQEAEEDGQISTAQLNLLNHELEDTAKVILEHESIIIDKIFEKGAIKGITENQLKHFVESRLDICVENLGFKGIFKPTYNPIAKWFYKDLESSTLHDFFSSTGNDYNRNWIEGKFQW
ncbi:NrdF Ribonucleotide reductase, beta subunit [uncultured Caudovirales phage]|uniref:ribonucleoside-diphosphate reductase n=1 Tax=uncultured Caudovirales phage TaxID=2100421 RepID=A0A6J5T4E8_9CAUD|nr:NrdF Ribonucleotide reductase, beta subunit [uncultured Caudovirales phage]